jgi:hypothetical protein
MTHTMSTITSRHSRIVALSVITVVVLGHVVSGCGNDETPANAAATTTTVAVGHTGDHHRDHATVDVRAVDFAFENLPRTIEAGTKLTLSNGAASELHELVAIRLPDGEDRPVPELLQLPEAELGALLGASPPATVLLAAPGGDQISAVGDGTITEPGRYLIMCSIPMGVAPAVYLAVAAEAGGEQPDVAGGPPHFLSGMATDLIVE